MDHVRQLMIVYGKDSSCDGNNIGRFPSGTGRNTCVLGKKRQAGFPLLA